MDVLQVLLRAGHPQQGGRAAVGVPVRRRAQRHRGDRLQQLLMLLFTSSWPNVTWF